MRSILSLSLSLLASCSAPGPQADLVPIAGCVAAPDGVSVARVVSSVDQARVRDGCFEISALAGGPQLTIALNGRGDPVLMAWIDPDRPDIDPAGTAAALGWFAIGGPSVGAPASERLLGMLRDSPELDGVAQAIVQSLERDERAFANPEAPVDAVAAALRDFALRATLLDGDEETPPPSLLIDPLDEQSGTRIVSSAAGNSAVLHNRWRRDTYAWVDRVATVDDEGRETPSPAEIAEFELPAVQSLHSWVDGFAQIVTGLSSGDLSTSPDLAYVPRISRPVRLDQVEGARRTRYEIVVAGPGARVGDRASLSAERRQRWVRTSLEFAVREFLIPIFLNVVLPASRAGSSLDSELGPVVVRDVAALLLAHAPTIGERIAEGDLRGGMQAMWIAMSDSRTLRLQVLEIIRDRFFDFRTPAGARGYDRASELARGFVRVTEAIDAVFTLGDGAFVLRSVSRASQAETWTVDVADSKVTLEPRASTIHLNDTLRLTARVLGADRDAELEYRFRTSSPLGTLRTVHQEGPEVQSSQPWVDFAAGDDTGVATIEVDIYEIDLSERHLVGSGAAVVEITDDCEKVEPREIPPEVHVLELQSGGEPFGYTYMAYRFGRVEGVFSYTAEIEAPQEFAHILVPGTYDVTRWYTVGRPRHSYQDAGQVAERYAGGLADALSLADGELLYLPHAQVVWGISHPDNYARFVEIAAERRAAAAASTVRLAPNCP